MTDLPFELTAVAISGLILLALLVVQGVLVPINHGFAWGLGARDEPREPSRIQGRARRAVANHIEGMLVFVPLVLVAHLGGISSPLTVWGAWLFVAGRALFVPVYLAGIPVLRSAVWGMSMAGILMIAIEVLGALV